LISEKRFKKEIGMHSIKSSALLYEVVDAMIVTGNIKLLLLAACECLATLHRQDAH
jgi:hypothetical protein